MSHPPTASTDTNEAEEASTAQQSWLIRRGLLLESASQRKLALGGFVNQLGTAAFLAAVPLYALKVIGLPVAQVGLGLSVAGVVGLFAGIPVGHLADRYGPRGIFLLTLLIQTVSVLSLLLAHSFLAFTLAVAVTDLAGSSGGAARGPMIRRFGGDEVPKFRSYLRSVACLASTFGALGAGVVLQIDTAFAYRTLIAFDALTFVLTVAVMYNVPKLEPLPQPDDAKPDRWAALKDKPYLAFVVVDGFMWIQGEVLTYALPLWVVLQTDAPRWFVGAGLAVNTVMVVFLQIRTSRGISGGQNGGRAIRRAGVAFLAGMGVIAITSGMPGWAAVIVMTVGVAVHTVGELWHAAGSLELRFRLAPAHAQGQYSGVFGMGMGLCYAVAPSLLGLLCVTWGAPGWYLMGGLFVAAGFAMPFVVRWAAASRDVTAPASA